MSIQQFLFDPGLPVVSMFAGFDFVQLRKRDKAKAAQLALLECLLADPRTPRSTDDILRSLNEPYPDGGKWLGPAIRELYLDGLIRPVNVIQSGRRSRNRGYVTTWMVGDMLNAVQRIELLKKSLTLQPKQKNDSKAGTNESSDSPTNIRKDEQANG